MRICKFRNFAFKFKNLVVKFENLVFVVKILNLSLKC